MGRSINTRPSRCFPPRALLHRPKITVEITPHELYLLIQALEARADKAAEDPATEDYADYTYQRIAVLREAGR
jgi:hypothetical protein